MTPAPGSPTQKAQELCEAAHSALSAGSIRERVALIRDRLRSPLRVAIAGRVSSGKSTLVNALLSRRIAATDAGECTKVVTAFHYGTPWRVTARLRDGSNRTFPLPQSGPVTSLGVNAADVDVLDVSLTRERLKATVIIDTPGLASANDEVSGRTQTALGMQMDEATRRSVSEAEAVVYLIATVEGRADADALDALGVSAMTTVGVLAKADRVGDGGMDALDQAARLAASIAGRLTGRVATVVPVSTLLAETLACGGPSDHDLLYLEKLAAVPRSRRVYWSKSQLLAADVDVPAAARESLYSSLAMFGILHCLDWIEQGVRGEALRSRLRELSGIDTLEHKLREDLLPRSEPLKAHWALTELERASYVSSDPENAASLRRLLSSGMNTLLSDRAMLEIQEMRALRDAVAAPGLPDDLRADMVRLFTGRSVADKLGLDGAPPAAADALRAAQAGAGRWAQFENSPRCTFRLQGIARTARRAYTHLWTDLQQQPSRVRDKEPSR